MAEEVCILNSSNIFKLTGLIVGIVFLNIVILSPGLIGVEIGGASAFQTALGITLLVISILVVLYGSYIWVIKVPVVTPVRDIQTHEDYIIALSHYKNEKALKKDILLALDQLDRMEKRRDTFADVLSQRFDPAELSYKRFNSVIYEVEQLFYLNIKGILNKLSVFNASEFPIFTGQQTARQFSEKIVQQKTKLYHEYLNYVTGYLEANEEILLKLDKLLLEISLLGSTDYREIEEMPCMKEIDALINQTKYYK
ncbi:hypothetical protein [Paenibacillus woosongensis]|uniref:hypothetical protein n=1 Tax=Paenibacillus woosongensis TaxID=307580 RepID=UPI001E432472|nr:hypothetical protein [Paenibacillus woosongensis]